MKKYLIIAAVLFGIVTSLSLASNLYFSRVNEIPPSEHTISFLLTFGLLLETPFILIVESWRADAGYVNYQLLSLLVVPFITGAVYATLYFFIVFSIKKIFTNRPQNTVT